jgi:hypothetical protein
LLTVQAVHLSFSLVEHKELSPYRLLLKEPSHVVIHGCHHLRFATSHRSRILTLAPALRSDNFSVLVLWCLCQIFELGSTQAFHLSFPREFKWDELIERVLNDLLLLNL